MNLYLKALGFSNMDSKEEKRFVQTAARQCVNEGFVLKQEIFKRGVIVVRISPSTGLYIYGRYEGKRFIYEYSFPFVIGNIVTENDEITIERHLDKESFAVICDELRTGVTLIFYLQNIMDYLDYVASTKNFKPDMFNLDRRNIMSKTALKGKQTIMTALSLGGMILLPIKKNDKNNQIKEEADKKRRQLIAAAKNGDEDAIETLTIRDIDMYNKISHRILFEDVFSIVDSTFMPCGVECDQYSVIGEILKLSKEENIYTGETIYIMVLECNDMVITMAINSCDLVGEPAVGRRFKGQIWLQGTVKFNK